MKLLLVFMLLFTAAFAGAFLWFNDFATEKALQNLQEQLTTAAKTAASMIDPNELMQVYETGMEGDPQYEHIAAQLRLVRDGNDRFESIYIMVRSDTPGILITVVSGSEDAQGRLHLRETYDASAFTEMLQGFDGPIADTDYGADEYGVWLSGYAPIRDAAGAGLAIVGVDMTAEEVILVQNQVQTASILGFVIAYVVIFLGAFYLSGSITRSLRQITGAAGTVEAGEEFAPETLAKVAGGRDEIGQLARVFSRMAVQIQAREKELKKQVAMLTIEIDEIKRQKQVAEIVENDSFKELQERARALRRGRTEGNPPDGEKK
jgi:HAMP domain-containing protein